MAVRFDSTGSDQYYESPQNDSTDDMLPGAGALNGNDSILKIGRASCRERV